MAAIRDKRPTAAPRGRPMEAGAGSAPRPPVLELAAPGEDDDPCDSLARYSPRVACAIVLSVTLLSCAYSFVVQGPLGYATPPADQEVTASLQNMRRPMAPGAANPGTGEQVAGATAAAPQPPAESGARTSAAPPPAASPREPLAATTPAPGQSTGSASTAALSPAEREAASLRLFCFAWTPRRKSDEHLMPYVRKLFAACDGHAFFTDMDAPGKDEEGFIKVPVPPTRRKRSDPMWMNHQNMVGLAPAWTYILEHDIADKYDWLINAELDHFMVASRARRSIVDHLNVLRNGSAKERQTADGPLMLSWGNVFVFNRKIALEMKQEWARLSAPIASNKSLGMGCPQMTAGRANSAGACEQDMAYPGLPHALRSKAAKYGPEGCSQTKRSDKGIDLPFACWQDFPLGSSDKDQMAAIREIALMRGIPTPDLARRHCETRGANVKKACMSLYRARDVPVMHNVKTPAVHKLARELLLP